MTPLVAYLILFVAVGAAFILVNLLVGKFVRPHRPGAEKKTIYECGEPTIGSAWIQFDLRFYVVALLFVIFDVEVAFFFPWAEVFGKSNNLAVMAPEQKDTPEAAQLIRDLSPAVARGEVELRQARAAGADHPGGVVQDVSAEDFAAARQSAGRLAWLAFLELLVFFGVLLVGFAYLWKRGDLAWVRSTLAEQSAEREEKAAESVEKQSARQPAGAAS
jgi:NADH-quinone oxidoreductase subunit A